MVEVPFENEPFISIDMHVSGAVIASPSQEDVVTSTDLTHGMLPLKVTFVKRGSESSSGDSLGSADWKAP